MIKKIVIAVVSWVFYNIHLAKLVYVNVVRVFLKIKWLFIRVQIFLLETIINRNSK